MYLQVSANNDDDAVECIANYNTGQVTHGQIYSFNTGKAVQGIITCSTST